MSGIGFFNVENISNKNFLQKIHEEKQANEYEQFENDKKYKINTIENFQKKILLINQKERSENTSGNYTQKEECDRFLRDEFSKHGISFDRDCFSVDTINCIDSKKLNNFIINKYSPKSVFVFGDFSLKNVVGNVVGKKNTSIYLLRGWRIPDQNKKTWICPMFDPEYVFFEKKREEILTTFRLDMLGAIETSEKSFPDYSGWDNNIKTLYDDSSIMRVLSRVFSGEEGNSFSFNYKTNGIKPYGEGMKIVIVSLATERGAYSFLWNNNDYIKNLWVRLLRSPNIGKISHDMKFNDNWSKEILKTDVRNWIWDTKLAAHVIDNRVGLTGLKMQTYLNFGISTYDDSLDYWLKQIDEKDGNSINRIDDGIIKIGPIPFLRYSGIDSLFCFWLAKKQAENLND